MQKNIEQNELLNFVQKSYLIWSIWGMIGKYCDLHMQSSTLSLADEFKSLYTNNIRISNADSVHLLVIFFHCQYVIANSLKNDESTVTEVDILLMTKGIRGVKRHANHQYAESNNSYMKYHNESKGPSYLLYWDVNN